MVHCALWSAAACCRFSSCGVCSESVKAQASLRRKQACALQRRIQECWSFAKSFSAASASQRTTPMILSRRQFSKTLFAAPFVLRAQQEPLRAHVKIDTERAIGDIDPKSYGNFIEHLGRCIYGGVFEEGSPLSDANGFRRDVLDAVRPLRVPILRWPGGNFVSGYHWLDGVGPVADRPRRSDLAWFAEESNRFGTNQFIEYCRLLGTEPYICVNMGSGTMDEAQAWVEYCNGTGNTSWANLRRQHGHPEPYRVRYWGLGNEMYGGWQIGNMNAHDYVKKARAFAMVMKRTDPSIQLIGCGQNGWSEWDEITLNGLAEF